MRSFGEIERSIHQAKARGTRVIHLLTPAGQERFGQLLEVIGKTGAA